MYKFPKGICGKNPLLLDIEAIWCEIGAGVDMLLLVISRREADEDGSILILDSFGPLKLVSGIEPSPWGEIWPLVELSVLFALFEMNELLNGRPESVKPVKS